VVSGTEFDNLKFQASSFCTSGGCVEVARLPDGQVVVRDGKDGAKPAHIFSADEWRDFVTGVKNGEFD
jgi:Domain of unknown function (DUF397)